MPRRSSKGGTTETWSDVRDAPATGRASAMGRAGGGATGLVVDRSAGMNGAAWIPDTASFASLGRRSGMTKAAGGMPGEAGLCGYRFGAAWFPPPPRCARHLLPMRGVGGWASALAAGYPPPHEVGAEVASRSDDGGGAVEDEGRRRSGAGGGAGLVVDRIAGMGGEAWIPDTSSFAALGRRSGMTKAGARRPPTPRPQRPHPKARAERASGGVMRDGNADLSPAASSAPAARCGRSLRR